MKTISALHLALLTFALSQAPSSFADTASTPASAPATTVSQSTPSTGKARIRLYGQNAINVRFYRNHRCYETGFFGMSGGESVSGSFGAELSSALGVVSNSSIGMPATERSLHVHDRDVLMSTAYYREYDIQPGEPLTVAAQFGAPNRYCPIIALSFVPQANKDYEVSLDLDAHYCRLLPSVLLDGPAPVKEQELEQVDKAEKC